MATIPMRCSIFIHFLVLFGVCCNCQSENPGDCSSWKKLQISPNTLTSMKYGNFLIEIYEHVNNNKAITAGEKKYFYCPIALLDHKSAVSTYNRVTKQPEMRFRVEMWNDKVENEVVRHLNKIVSQEIQPDNVRVLPLEKVILVSKRPTTDYSPSPEWTNYDKSKTLWFHLSCYDREVCEELADEMRSDPKHFHHFNLLYSLSSQKSQTKQTSITIDSVTSGQMVTTLLQKFRDKKEVFLTANDEKKMLTETAINIRMDTFDDSEVVSPATELQIFYILKDLLVTSRMTIKEQSDKTWDSVFWNEDNYRPDKMTKTLNGIIKKLDPETQKKLADMFLKAEMVEKTQEADKEQSTAHKWELIAKNNSNAEQNRNLENKEIIQHNYDSSSWVYVDRISLQISKKIANDSYNSSRRVEFLEEDVTKLLQESRNHVQWDGVKFVPNSMQLSRINLGKFRDSFQDRNVRVRYTNAELSVPIKFMEHAELTVINEWENLKEELKATTELLNTTVNNLVKTNTELKVTEENLKKDLKATLSQLETIKTNLTFMRTELGSTKSAVADLAAKLNARTSELVDIGKMPTSCSDLQQMGQKVNGFFLVKGSKKMEIVYCNFHPNKNSKQNDLQKYIGYADVKSAPVHFYVQRNSSFETLNTPIPFDLTRVNEGNAMNLTSGVFTAPRPGTYFFSFTGLAKFPTSSSQNRVFFGVYLYLNGGRIGLSWVKEGNTVDDQDEQITLHSMLNLKKGDRVWVAIVYVTPGVKLYDNDNHNIHFTGFLLEEEIVASL